MEEVKKMADRESGKMAGAFDTAIKEWEQDNLGIQTGNFEPPREPISNEEWKKIKRRGWLPTYSCRHSGIK